MENFVVIPRTTITSAVNAEQAFQTSGMTDADTMARLGNQFGADYVMSGSITRLGSSNLLIVSVVKIDVIQQVAGDYSIYNSMDDFHKDESIIRKMTRNIVAMMSGDSVEVDKLAVLPVMFSGNASKEEGDALAQLLSIFLLKNGKYSVYPRTKTLEQVKQEYMTQLSGQTRDSEAVAIGYGVNPPYALSIVSRRIGTGNVFNAVVIDIEGGNQISGYSEQYSSLNDGIDAMNTLAKQLSGIKGARRGRGMDVAMDKFLRNSGINFTGWLGLSFFRISQSPDSGSGSSGGTESENKDKLEALWYGGAKMELRLSPYFGIQTGVGGAQKLFNNEVHTALQIPALLRVNIRFRGVSGILGINSGLFLSPFGGIGFNFLSQSGAYSPTSLIVGAEIGTFIGSGWAVFIGYQYNHDFADKDYMGRTSVVTVGLSYFLPFRKD